MSPLVVPSVLLVGALSVASQPRYSPQGRFDGSPVPGRESLSIDSAVLGEARRVLVSLPASFARSDPSRRYPVVIILDGEGQSATAAVAACTELARHGLIPESIVAAVENTDSLRGRLRDLTPPGLSVSGSSLNEGGDRFLDFLERELLPMLQTRYRAAAPRVLIGHSSGGILATYAAASRPTFGMVVAIDFPGDIGDGWLGQRLVERARKGGLPLRYVSYGARYGWPDEVWTRVVEAAPANWRIRYEHLRLETHQSVPMIGAYMGLREVFADYSRVAAPQMPTTSIIPHYDALTAAYGGQVDPPAGLLREVIEDLLMEGRGADARRAFERLVRGYGEPADSARIRAEIAEAERQPPPSETVESLLSTPFPTAEEAALYLGEWVGEETTPGGTQPRKVIIQVEGGHVVAYRITYPNGTEVKSRLRYLTVGKDEFTFGFVNGMRPYGMLLYTMRRNGDRFEGEQRWGGVRVTYPDGVEPPRFSVVLRKSGG